MIYTQYGLDRLGGPSELIGAIGSLQFDPLAIVSQNGELIACTDTLLEWFGAGSIEQLPSMAEWFIPVGMQLQALLAEGGQCRGKVDATRDHYDAEVRAEIVPCEGEALLAVVFHDTTVLERAKAAERYFDHFKKKFLSNISHEFRTPMNAILGFSELLRSTPLNSFQEEYAEMTHRSALSMMRNIENLLELMQVESGVVHANPTLFHPLEVYEEFSQQFADLALSKQIQLMFMIDPHLPKTMLGDQDKILSVLRNLIQNGIKFTSEGGNVFVEIIIVNHSGTVVEVEYAVSDTGVGIEPERIKTLLRPFASGWENQRSGKDGLGIGLNLSHKYVEMMNSHLMLASTIGKGSRFSFRITHRVHEKGSFDFIEESRAAIYSTEPRLSGQGALLYRYLELFKVKTRVVHSLISDGLEHSDILFLDMPYISTEKIDSIRSTYPNLQIVPIMKVSYGERSDALVDAADSVVTLPILPGSLHKTLAVLWNKMPKEYIAKSPEVQSVPRQENIKILVAEDNPINLRLLETVLRHEHFQVVAVDNGQKAVDAYLKERFDLVLMDIDMPVMDGLTANRLIKEIDKRDRRGYVPVIALTAHALIGDRERIVAAGLDAHLAKPIDKHFLLQTIDRFMKIAQTKQEGKIV